MSIAVFLYDNEIDFETKVIYEFYMNHTPITCEILNGGKVIGKFFHDGADYSKVFKDQETFITFIKTLESKS